MSALNCKSETEFESHIRALIAVRITKGTQLIYALKNEKADDILICKDSPQSALYFIVAKYHQSKHGRLDFRSGNGGEFQPEIVSAKPAYFKSSLRRLLVSEEYALGKVIYLPLEVIRKYLTGSKVDEKLNNTQKTIFVARHRLSEGKLIEKLRKWLGAQDVQPFVARGWRKKLRLSPEPQLHVLH